MNGARTTAYPEEKVKLDSTLTPLHKSNPNALMVKNKFQGNSWFHTDVKDVMWWGGDGCFSGYLLWTKSL